MLAQKFSPPESELPTRPFNAVSLLRSEAAPAGRTHLMLVRTPRPTPRGLAWALKGGALPLDALALTSMLRLERLNLG
jgi:hypothetical protein